MSVLLRITSSDYPFGFIRRFVYSNVCHSSYYGFWPPLSFHQTICLFYCLSFVLRLLTTPLVSSDVLSILFSVLLRIAASAYPVGLIRRFVYSIVCSSSYYVFWLPLWFHQRFCLFYCLFFFVLRLLTTPLVSSDVSSILMSVLLRITASDYPLGLIRRFVYSIVCSSSYYVFWLPLWSHQRFCLFYCLSFFVLRLLTTPLVSSHVLSILVSVLLRITASDYPFGLIRRFVYSIVCPSSYYVFWLPIRSHQTFFLFYCLSFVLRLLTTPLVSSDVFFYSNVCPSSYYVSDHTFGFIRRFVYSIVFPSYYVFWLPLWSHQTFCLFYFLSFLELRFCLPLRSHQTFFLFYCLFFFVLPLLTTPIVSSDVFSILMSVLLRITSSDYPFGLIRRFVYSIVCSSSYYVFWLPLWFHQTFCLFYCLFCFVLRLLTTPLVLSVVLSILMSVLLRFTSSDYPFGLIRRFFYSIVCSSSHYVFWLPLWSHHTFCLFYCLSFVLRLLTTPLVSSDVLSILLSVLLRIGASDYPLGLIRRFVYSIVCPSSYYVFWLPLWSHQMFCLFYCLSFFVLRLLATPLGSSDVLSILLSVLLRIAASDYPLGLIRRFVYSIGCPSYYVFWLPLWSHQTFCLFYCLSFFVLRLLTTPLVSSVVLSILLSVLLRMAASDYPLGLIRRFVYSIGCPSYYVFWLPLWSHQTFFLFYCLSFFVLRLLTIPLVSSDVLSILLAVLRITSSDYPFGLIRRFFYSIVCSSSHYVFWLPLWSHQTFCLFYCLSFFVLRLLTTPLVSSVVLSILLSVLLRIAASDYPLGLIRGFVYSIVSPSSYYVL